MTAFLRETVLRVTARFDEGDRPEFKASTRTTIVVTRAVLEDAVGSGREVLYVYGYRKERPPTWPGYDQPGQEPKTFRWVIEENSRRYPVGIPELVHRIRRSA